MLRQSDELSKTIDILKQQYALQQQLAGATHEETQKLPRHHGDHSELRDKLANFDDFFRPMHSYFYWEKHCYDIPACFALRSTFEAIDGIDQLSEKFEDLTVSLDKLDAMQPQAGRADTAPDRQPGNQSRADADELRHACPASTRRPQVANDNATALGRAFDAAKNDDLFYLPPEVFDNPDFKRGLKLFLSPDGKAARMIITHEGDPATDPKAFRTSSRSRRPRTRPLKGTPMADASFYLGGTAATYKDIQDWRQVRPA